MSAAERVVMGMPAEPLHAVAMNNALLGLLISRHQVRRAACHSTVDMDMSVQQQTCSMLWAGVICA